MNTMPWYAIRVRSRFEQTTATVLKSMGYEVFLPMYRVRRKWSDRIKDLDVPLFSGYLFCSMDVKNRLPVLQAPGVVDVVGCGKTAMPVDDEEIASVRAMVNSNLVVHPCPFLQRGDKVRLRHGPLAGLEGIIVNIKGCTRLVVRLTLLQRAVAADVCLDWVEPIPQTLPQPYSRPAIHPQ